ncbi:MAG: hypothetical protein GXP42_14855, partial [Chloroflexi bacterium]|nr:hypothetical protein [Chloroflexota bacterium]
DEVTPLVVEIMESAYELKAPLKAEPEYGPDWYDLRPWRPPRESGSM